MSEMNPNSKAETHRETYPLRAARKILELVLNEYLVASHYYRQIGVQGKSEEYGGSRSLIYYQMLGRTTRLRDLVPARKEFLGMYNGPAKDESGALLRIAGYRVRNIPGVGDWFKRKVKQDDTQMLATPFDYPDGYERVTGEPEPIKNYLERARQRE